MKNLKRILSLALASVMVMGMMVVGASAAFEDQDEINALNTDAVNTMVALGVIKGKEGNKFDPKGNVTRAEMATMIAMSLNGGNADFRGTTTTGFTDVDGVAGIQWAAKFIKYCVDQGILSGVGGGKFNPNANVTAQEAATMILTAMGYKKEMLKSETSDWAAKINLTAEQRKLYDDTKVTDYTQKIDRETAAQMVFNGITVWTPVINDTYNVTTGEHMYSVDATKTNPTILTSAFKAKMEYAVMDKIELNEDGTITYTLDGARGLEAAKFDNGTSDTLTCEADYSELFQRQVKVIYSGTAGARGAVVIGMTAAGDDILSEGALGLLDTRSSKLDGKGIDAASVAAVPYYDFMDDTRKAGLVGHMSGNEIHTYKLIDQDLNGKVDYAVVTPLSVAKVTFVGKDSISVNDGSRTDAYKFKAADIYSGVARNDYVTIVDGANTLDGAPVIRKMEPITGTLTNENSADDSFKMNGEWYTILTGGPDGLVNAGASATFAVGDEVEVYTIGNYVVAGGPVGESSATTLGNILYVAATDNATGMPTAGQEIPKTFAGKNPGIDTSVIFTDGTSQIVKTMRVDTYEYTTSVTGNVSTANNTAIFTAANKKATVPAPGLYSYTVNDDGMYELKAIKAENATGTAYVTAATNMYVLTAANLPAGISLDEKASVSLAWDKSEGKVEANNKYFVADDAVVILVKLDDKKFDVISGKELKVTSDWGTSATVLYKNVSGLGTAQMILVTHASNELPTVDGTTQYGYITSAGVGELNGNKYNIRFTAWTVDGEQELVAVAGATNASLSNADLGDFAKGKFVTFKTTTTAGKVTDVAAVSGTSEVAILGYDNPTTPETVRIDNTSLGTSNGGYVTIDENTVVFFINTADKKGVEGATLVEATEVATGVYTKNALIKVAADNTVDVLLVDTNNQLAGAEYTVTHDTDAAAGTKVKVAADATLTYGPAGSTTTVVTGDKVKAGTTVTITLAADAGNAATTADETVKVTITLADSTTIVRTIKVAAGKTFGTDTGLTVTFSMPYQNVTDITVTVE